MKNRVLLILALVTGTSGLFAQNGNVGIGTTTPGSRLTVNGSFAATYNNVSATTYTMTAGDYYLAWNGTTAGTVTLPAALAIGSGNYLGRVYHIKNTSAVSLTVAANGTELIDNQSGAGVSNFVLRPGYYAMIVSKGTTTGTTWEVAIQTGTITGAFQAINTINQNINTASAAAMAFNSASIDDNGDVNTTVDQIIVTGASAGLWYLNCATTGQNFSSAGSSNFNSFLQKSTDGGINWVSIPTASAGANTTGNEINTASINVMAQLNAGDRLRIFTVVCNGCTATGIAFRNTILQGFRLR